MENDNLKGPCKRGNYVIEKDRTTGFHNYCVCGIMAKCSAGSRWKEQRACKFSKKSSIGDWCMHYRELINGHCDCVNAQKELKKKEGK